MKCKFCGKNFLTKGSSRAADRLLQHVQTTHPEWYWKIRAWAVQSLTPLPNEEELENEIYSTADLETNDAL